METAKECPTGFMEIVQELHKVQLDAIESNVVCSVDNNFTTSKFVTIYIHDPKPRKNSIGCQSFDFKEFENEEEYRKNWKKMKKYYSRMKEKATKCHFQKMEDDCGF